jgi:hypothetical protein
MVIKNLWGRVFGKCTLFLSWDRGMHDRADGSIGHAKIFHCGVMLLYAIFLGPTKSL